MREVELQTTSNPASLLLNQTCLTFFRKVDQLQHTYMKIGGFISTPIVNRLIEVVHGSHL